MDPNRPSGAVLRRVDIWTSKKQPEEIEALICNQDNFRVAGELGIPIASVNSSEIRQKRRKIPVVSSVFTRNLSKSSDFPEKMRVFATEELHLSPEIGNIPSTRPTKGGLSLMN